MERYEMAAELIVNVIYVLLGAYELFVLPGHDMIGKICCLGFAGFFVFNRSWVKKGIQDTLEALF